jgi:hypothetical protein
MSRKLKTPDWANEPMHPESNDKNPDGNDKTWVGAIVGVAEKIGSEAFVVLASVSLLIYFGRTDWPLLMTVLAAIWSLFVFRVVQVFFRLKK